MSDPYGPYSDFNPGPKRQRIPTMKVAPDFEGDPMANKPMVLKTDQTPIDQSFRRLGHSINSLDVQVKQLEDRLVPVMVPDHPESESQINRDGEDVISPIGARLDDLSTEIDDVTRRLARLLDRLEI